jgi:hypothetical protein
MYDDLMEKDPKMRRIRAESEAKGEAKGLKIAIMTIVNRRFPSLAEQVQQHVKSITKVEDLRALVEQVAIASDETAARSLLAALVDDDYSQG